MKSLFSIVPMGLTCLGSLLLACGGSTNSSSPSTNNNNGEALPISSALAAQAMHDSSLSMAQGLAPVINELSANAEKYCTCEEEADCACTPPEDMDAAPEKAVNWASNHLFQENHVVPSLSSNTEVVFCLQPADVCQTAEGSLDSNCQKALEQVPVCVRVRSFAANELAANVLVGAQQEYNPANLYIRPNQLRAEVSLTDVGSSVRAFLSATEKQIPENFPTLIKGKITAEMTKISQESISFALGIAEALEINMFPVGHEKHTEIRIAASPQLIILTADTQKKQIDSQLSLNEVDLTLPADTVIPAKECAPQTTCQRLAVPGNFLVHLDSAKLEATLVGLDNSPSITLRNISLGNNTSTVQYSRPALRAVISHILKIDLNPSMNRTLDATLTKTDMGMELGLSPGLEMIVDHDLTPIKDYLTDASNTLLKAITQIKVTGTAAKLLFQEESEMIKVLSGEVKLQASGMQGQDNIDHTVNAGQCIMENSNEVPENAHPFKKLFVESCNL